MRICSLGNHQQYTSQGLQNYIGTSAFDGINNLMADVKANFFVWNWTPAKMLLLADVDEYSFANADIIHYN